MSIRMPLALVVLCVMAPTARGAVGYATDQDTRWRTLTGLAYVSMDIFDLAGEPYEIFSPQHAAWSRLQHGGFRCGTLDGGGSDSYGYLRFELDKCTDRWTMRMIIRRDVDAPGDPGLRLLVTVWEEDLEVDARHREQDEIDGLAALIAAFTKDWVRANPKGV